jgi:large subunit ribosomal protein L15
LVFNEMELHIAIPLITTPASLTKLTPTFLHSQWIALTHKSFEHGAQGFNDRLAFLGKRLVDMQVSLALLSRPDPQHSSSLPLEDVYSHPALRGLENVSESSKQGVLQKSRLARLAATYKIPAAVRWKPRKSDNLAASGQDVIMAHTMYSMVGALALRQGGEIATRVVRERIIRPLGLR